jgi:hypothetical protein
MSHLNSQNILIAQLKIEKQLLARDLFCLGEEHGDLQQSYNNLHLKKSSEQSSISLETIQQQARTISQCDEIERKYQTVLEHIRLIKVSSMRIVTLYNNDIIYL